MSCTKLENDMVVDLLRFLFCPGIATIFADVALNLRGSEYPKVSNELVKRFDVDCRASCKRCETGRSAYAVVAAAPMYNICSGRRDVQKKDCTMSTEIQIHDQPRNVND